MKLTVPSKDDATAASVMLPALIFARTGAPNPIEESWRLKGEKQSYNNTAHTILQHQCYEIFMFVQPV